MAKRVTATEPVDGPWALPDGWKWERLADLGIWSGGGTPSKARPEFWADGTIPWGSPKDMKRPLIDSSEDSITVAAVAGSSTKMVPAGSVLCVMRSGILRHTFPVAVNTVDVTLNQDMRALVPRQDVEPRYLAYYLQFTGNTVLHTASKAGTTVNSIEASRLDRHPVPIVDTDRQRMIVARIDELFAEVDDGEASLVRARTDLATWRKALLKAAVTGELTADWHAANFVVESGADLLAHLLAERHAEWTVGGSKKVYKEPAIPRHDELPALPGGWFWATIEQLCKATRPVAYGVLQPGGDLHDGVPLVRVMDVRDGVIAQTELKRISQEIADAYPRTRLRGGEVLLTVVGSVGRTAVVPPSLAGANTARAVSVLPVGYASAAWVALALRYEPYRAALENSSHEVARKTLNLEDVRAFSLPVPPREEQDELVRRISLQLNVEQTLKTAKSDANLMLATLRQSILAAAFRGELA
jgi:type I restriction enzyme S subunit